MLVSALQKGFDILGFSAHAMYPFASLWHLSCRDFDAYTAEITRLKKAYADKITVALGFEADYIPPFSAPQKSRYAQFGAEYLIGSVHYAAGGSFAVDADAREVALGIKNHFGGDGKKFVLEYFRNVRDMLYSCDFDIVGHIDVIRKRNGELRFFDERDDWYRREIEETAKVAAQKGVIVEINTGGIARGAIDDVYPSQDFLSALNALGVPVMINSDAHSADGLDHSFERACLCAKNAGYSEITYLLDGQRKKRAL